MRTSLFALIVSAVLFGAIAVACGGSQTTANTAAGDGGIQTNASPRDHDPATHDHVTKEPASHDHDHAH